MKSKLAKHKETMEEKTNVSNENLKEIFNRL